MTEDSLATSFDKAVEQVQAKADSKEQPAEATQVTATQPAGQANSQEAPNSSTPTEPSKREWDGKPETLADELKQDPKAVQRAYTRIAQARAEADKKAKELEDRVKAYEGTLDPKELEAYKNWKLQQAAAKPVTELTPQQMQAVMKDPALMQQYLNTIVNQRLAEAYQVIGPEIAASRQQRETDHWAQVISDFGEVHPDMWEMHKSGLFKPILEATVKAGGTLEDAYKSASQIRDSIRAEEINRAQAQVQQKRDMSSFSGRTSASDNVVLANNKREAFDAAFNLAWDKKQGTVKIKK